MSNRRVSGKISNITTGTVNSSGDNVILPAPGSGSRYVIRSFVIQDESATPAVLRLVDGSNGKGWRYLAQNQGDHLAMTFSPDSEWIITDNAQVKLNLSTSESCGYTLHYYEELT
jgi:hypothetical protein